MYHLYAVMQVSMSEHVNHILASHTLSPTASSPASFEFLISDPLHSYNCKVFSSRSYFTFSPSPKIFFSCSFSFYFPDFSKVHIYYTCRLSYNLLTRHVAWRYFDTPSLSFFSLFRFLRFFVNEVHTRVPYTWLSLLFCPQKMIFIIICVLISAVILVAIIIGCLPRT